MRNGLIAVALLNLGLLTSSWGQVSTPTENPIWQPCPQLAYLPESDSVGRQATVDSVAEASAGRWELVEIAGGWGPNLKPGRRTVMTLNRDGEGMIYEDDQWSATFQLTLKRRYGSIWFTIDEPGKPYFNFRLGTRRNGSAYYGKFGLCSQKLIISDARAHGAAFAFRRISTAK